jgi:hypothetical protein
MSTLHRVYIYAYQEISGDPISKDAISIADPLKSLVDHPSSEMARRMDNSHTPIPHKRSCHSIPQNLLSFPFHRLSWLITLRAAASPSVSGSSGSTGRRGGGAAHTVTAGRIRTGMAALIGYWPHNCDEPDPDQDIGL